MITPANKVTLTDLINQVLTSNNSGDITGAEVNNLMRVLSGYIVSTIYKGASAPPQADDRLWIDTSVTPNVAKFWDGAEWSEITAYSGSGKIANTIKREITVSSSDTFDLPAGSILEYIKLVFATGGSYSVGTTASGTEIANGTGVTTDDELIIVQSPIKAATTIHFTGTFTAYIYYKP